MKQTNPESTPPVLNRPAPLGRTLVLAVFALLSGLGLTRYWDASGPQPYFGTLDAERTPLIAERDARIDRFLVAEGDVVRPGQRVVAFHESGVEAALDDLKARIAALEVEYAQTRARAEVDLAWRMKQLDAEILDTRLKSAALLEQRFGLELEGVAWRQFLREPRGLADASEEPLFRSVGYQLTTPKEARIRAMVSEEQARNAAEVYATQLALCQSRLEDLEQLKHQLPANVHRAAGVDVARMRLEQARTELAHRQRQRDERALTSTHYGTVGVFRKQPGDAVVAGDCIVEILDHDRRFVVAHVPSRQLSRFRHGMEVSLEFPGGQQRTGRVMRVPPQTVGVPSDGLEGDALVELPIQRAGKLWPEAPIGSVILVRLPE